MNAMELWANLDTVFHLTPRELYTNPEMEELHRASRREVEQMSNSEQRVSLSVYIRDVMLSDDALARGIGWEDVLAFLDWIDGGME